MTIKFFEEELRQMKRTESIKKIIAVIMGYGKHQNSKHVTPTGITAYDTETDFRR